MTTHRAVVSRWISVPLGLLVGAVVLSVSAPAALAQTCTGCPAASFAQRARLFDVGADAKAVATGDLDGDGDPDLLVAGTDGLSVLRGDGAGGFSPETRYLPGDMQDLAVGDLDGDGHLDVVTTSVRSHVSVFRGDGNGGLASPDAFPIDYVAKRLALGDLNGDGKLDLVAGTSIDVAVALGDGAGGFGPVVRYADGTNPTDVAVADVTGDGRADVIVATGNGAPGPGDIWILKSQPSGALVLIGHTLAGTYPRGLAVGDFDRNGIADVAVTLFGQNGPGAVALLRGLGGGALAPAVTFPVATYAYALTAGDWNGDGRLDVALACGPILSVLLGDGAGGFGPQRRVPGVGGVAITSADFDADGRADLALANEGPQVRVASVYTGDGQGGFGPPLVPLESAPLSLGVGDFNRDGKRDLVTTHFESNTLSVVIGDGQGGFGPAVSFQTIQYPWWVAVGDVNGDGADDVVAASVSSTGVAVHLGDGNGGLLPPVPIAVPQTGGVELGDFNGDTHLDIALSQPGANAIRVLLGNGAGGFGPPSTVAATNPGYLKAADVSGDGKLDLVSSVDPPGYTPASSIEVLIGNGNGTFAPAQPLPLGGPSFPGAIGALDLNADGLLDLAVLNVQYISVFLGTGGGQFGPVQNLAAGVEANHLAVADFNGDGRPDVAITGLSRGMIVYHGDGIGGLGAPQQWGAIVAGRIVAADFDGDGRADLATLASWSRHVVVYRNTNCKARQLKLVANVSGCNVPGTPFAQQPVADVADDAGQRVSCETGTVTASILPGTGSAGAGLGGTTAVPLAAGRATFTDLEVDLPGGGYRLELTHAATTPVRTRAFSQALAPAIAGPALVAPNTPVTYDAGPGYASYVWRLDGNIVSQAQTLEVSFPALSTHALDVTVTANGCSAQALLQVQVVPVLAAGETTIVEGAAGPTLVSLVVSLSAASSGEVVVSYATADGSATAPLDYAAAAGSLTFAPGVTSRTLSLAVQGDTLDEPNEAFAVRLTGPVNAVVGHGDGRVVILDDDGIPSAGLPFELMHGTQRRGDLASAGAQEHEDWFVLRQQARASYEIVTDATSGDLVPLELVRVATDGSTVVQSSIPAGTGPSRSLRWENATGGEVTGERIRIRSGGCTTTCGPDDVYRVRAYETTYRITRFNNANGLRSVVLIHNPTTRIVQVTLSFWADDGTLLLTLATPIPQRGMLKLEAADIPELAGRTGSVTVTNDAPYAALGGKVAIVDLAGRFAFDSPLLARTY